MPSFAYQIRDASGNARVGVLEAVDIDEASRQLHKPGTIIVDIHAKDAAAAEAARPRGKVKRSDVIFFANQLAVMVKAGIRLQDSLESLASQTENRKFKAVITDLKCRIEGGQSLSQALAEHADVFNDLFINMVAL